MRNLIVSILIGVGVFAVLFFSGVLRMGEAIVPGVFVVLVAYFILARRTFKQVEAIFAQASKALQKQPPRFDLAVAGFEGAYPLASNQFGVRSQIDTQIGMLYFLQKEFGKALPFLERSRGFGHWMGTAMLAVVHYKKKDHAKMRDVLEIVTKRGKKQSLAWNLSAYLLSQVGDRDGAQQLLVKGLKSTKDDPKVQDALTAVQNGKKIKMRSYKEQWYQFHLERPPAQYQRQVMPQRVGKAARRGRW